ncbi:hypothetical protein MOF38_04860, partial [Bacillus haynesii]|uniref:hypothetical protein n=1 Tax=Bacillus haynesii TaxID=1925021 RepID=UPI00227E1C04
SLLKSLRKNKINFFNKEDEISLFHINQIEKNIFHVVFKINDVYQLGTKRMGNQHNFTYTSLINCFFFLDNNYLLIENVTSEYEADIVKYIEQKTGTEVRKTKISNNQFSSL